MRAPTPAAEALPALRVRVPEGGKVQGRAALVPYRTALFRKDTCLPEIFGIALERAPSLATLSAVIVGCSIGAEADSLLALYNASGRHGKVTLTGFDASNTAVQAARKGAYRLVRPSFDEEGRSQEEKALRSMGFAMSYEPNGHNLIKSASVIVDSTPVRQGHTVNFEQHDAAGPLPFAAKADLAVASNLLYHLTTEKAMRVAGNMAGILADRGVLSFGSVGSYGFNRDTKGPMEAMLYDDFGLEPVQTVTEELMIYART